MHYLTHYYAFGDRPFRSLSYLSDEEAISVARSFQSESAYVYKRFKQPESYWNKRRETENWLRKTFILRGGQPELEYPIYMVLGESAFIYEGYDRQCHIIQIPLSEFKAKQISFTYPDSMVSHMLLQERQGKKYFKPYHGKLFLLSEISAIAKDYGIPQQEWREDPYRAYDFFIEAQVWSREPLLRYIHE